MKFNLFVLFNIILLNFSCTRVLDIDIPDEDVKIVIEGVVTTKNDYYSVKLSQTQAYTSTDDFKFINDALVVINDDFGNVDTLENVNTNGLYLSKTPKQGVIGRTYTLTVKHNGETYSASDGIIANATIDTMYTTFWEADALHFTEGNYVYYSSYDDPTMSNYYLFKVYQNDSIRRSPNTFFATDDRFLAANIGGVELPGTFDAGSWAKLELFSISQKAYDYYFGLSNQLNSDGGFFSTPPANAPTNLSNGALGFFMASGYAVDSVYIPQK